MPYAPETVTPELTPTASFTDAGKAVARLAEIYERSTAFLRAQFESFLQGRPPPSRVRATYPFLRVTTTTHTRLDSRLAYGFVAGPGVYETTITRPDLFRRYLAEQIELLLSNHAVPVEIGESAEPIPVHFAYKRDINIETEVFRRDGLPSERPLRDLFDAPDLAGMDDSILNGTRVATPGEPAPLALFRAARIDYSLHRLRHYTGTSPEHFQNFVIFTNYQFYVDAFARIGRERMAKGDPEYLAYVEPGDVVIPNARLGKATSGAAPAPRTRAT
jgi:AMP nucleosidase